MEKKTTNQIKQVIGLNIKKIRVIKGIEVKQICAELGLSQAAYSNIERGKTDISISRLIQLSELLGVHFTAIVSDEHSMDSKKKHNPKSDKEILLDIANAYKDALDLLKAENSFLKNQNTEIINLIKLK